MGYSAGILTLYLSNVTLGDPAPDYVLRCARFRKWCAIKRISAYDAVSVLQCNLPEAIYSGIPSTASGGNLSAGKGNKTTKNLEEYLAFSLKLISSQACWGLPPTTETLIAEWDGLVQGSQDALQFTTSLLKVADKFKHLKPPIVKSITDIYDKFMAGANLPLRLYLRTAKLFVHPAD